MAQPPNTNSCPLYTILMQLPQCACVEISKQQLDHDMGNCPRNFKVVSYKVKGGYNSMINLKNKQITHTLKGFWAKSSKPKDDLDMNKS